MNEFEKRMMKLEKEQLVLTLSALLSNRYNDEAMEKMIHFMETDDLRTYLKKKKIKANIISILISITLITFIFWLVGGVGE